MPATSFFFQYCDFYCWLLRWLSFSLSKLKVLILPAVPVRYCRQEVSRGLEKSTGMLLFSFSVLYSTVEFG